MKDFHKYAAPPTYAWSGLDSSGFPLFVRDLSTDEIYALDLELP